MDSIEVSFAWPVEGNSRPKEEGGRGVEVQPWRREQEQLSRASMSLRSSPIRCAECSWGIGPLTVDGDGDVDG